MEIDEHKVDEMSLALLYLTTFEDKWGVRAWKGHSWDVLDRLHQSGYIEDPRSKAKSVLPGTPTQLAADRFPSRNKLFER